MRLTRLSLVLAVAAAPAVAQAGLTETLPAGAFLLDESFIFSDTRVAYDNDGEVVSLIPDIDRYEPGGGYQGTITVGAVAKYQVLVTQLRYGVFDNLTVGIGIPVAISTSVEPNLGWREGDYQRVLGRPYGEDDFWQWAGTLGQTKPGTWSRDGAALTDIYAGGRWRFSEHLPFLRSAEVDAALEVQVAIPTSEAADPEEITAIGTTVFDLHFQGEINFHLGVERTALSSERQGGGEDDRIRLGLDTFYEVLLPHEKRTPKGEKHPLLLSHAKYAGDTFTLDPGDFYGASLEVTFVPLVGPALGTWITGGDALKSAAFPPLLSVGVRYTFLGLLQSDWDSDSELFDWNNEKLWRPGYKNIFTFQAQVSLLRLGAPIQIYSRFRTMRILPGKNHRAVEAIIAGIQIPVAFLD